MVATSTSTTKETIPIVDISARQSQSLQDRQGLGDQLAHILHTVGFVIVTNHGISNTLIDQVFDQSSSFFQLPLEEKQAIAKRQSKHFRGWEPVGAESTNGQSDHREQIDLWTEYETSGGDDSSEDKKNNKAPIYKNLLGPNQWPSPKVAPEFRPTLEEWYQEMKALGDSLMGLFALGILNENEDRFQQLFGTDRMSLIKLISYPQTPRGSFGVHAHHDTGFLTILAAGVTPGLQVQSIQTGEWINVPVIPHSFVVNIGEALQHMTGNYFVATPHRVQATAPRLSCGYFHGPSLDTSLATLDDLPESIRAKVQASAYHREAGFMTQTAPTDKENGQYEEYNPKDRPKTWGALIWNYLARSYPDIMKQYYSGNGK